jgi:hypothetical protein
MGRINGFNPLFFIQVAIVELLEIAIGRLMVYIFD